MQPIHAEFRAKEQCSWCELKQNHASNDKIQFLFDYFDDAYTPKLTALKVARDVGYCPRHLQRICKREIGYTVGDLIRIRKMDIARSLLQDPEMTVKEVAYHVGYRNNSHFALAFKQTFGCNPSKYLYHGCDSNVD